MNIKYILSKILPASKLNVRILEKKINAISESQQKTLRETQKTVIETQKTIIKTQKAVIDNQQLLKNKINNLSLYMDNLKDKIEQSSRLSSEAVWANVFNNTISSSSWLNDKTFYPGRWAVGYPFLYVMYRILNEIKPQSILELGLGQTSRMIGQYAANRKNTKHYVVEGDKDWADFFINDFKLSEQSEIVILDYEFIKYKEDDRVRVYKDFAKTFGNKKFDFITIDAPFAGDMEIYSRIDLLSIIPDSLCESFVIMVDDILRKTEANMFIELENKLKENNIEYVKGKYSGLKDFYIIVSPNLSFLTTM
ncbi:MAG: class I SAM-dependent methyltransferase [Christensenellaceae bacterium]|nr:class I SAM-dependent methyltransferase [Christensenellaceae bacterium]